MALEVELSLELQKCSINSLFSAPLRWGTVTTVSLLAGLLLEALSLAGRSWQREQSLVSLTPEGTCFGFCCSHDSQTSTHLIHAASFLLSVIPCAP